MVGLAATLQMQVLRNAHPSMLDGRFYVVGQSSKEGQKHVALASEFERAQQALQDCRCIGDGTVLDEQRDGHLANWVIHTAHPRISRVTFCSATTDALFAIREPNP